VVPDDRRAMVSSRRGLAAAQVPGMMSRRAWCEVRVVEIEKYEELFVDRFSLL
jgi:hypothetical protein